MEKIKAIKKVTKKAKSYKELLRYFTPEEINDAYRYLGKQFNLADHLGSTTPAWMLKFKKFRNQIIQEKWGDLID